MRRSGPEPAGAAAEPITAHELDARLAVGTGTAWLLVLWGISWTASMALTVALALTGVGVSASLWALRHGDDAPAVTRFTWTAVASVAGLAALCGAVALLPLAGDLSRSQNGPMHRLARSSGAGTFRATVAADPRPVGGGAFGGSRFAVDARLHRLRSAATAYRVDVAIVVLGNGTGWGELIPGQRIDVDGRAATAPGAPLTAALITARGQPVLIGRPGPLQRLANRVRRDLRTACSGLAQPERGLVPGLVDGDTSALDPTLKQQFKVAGLTHIVAVSGTNLAIVIGVLLLVLRRARVPPWAGALLAGAGVVVFVVVARPSPSVLRAAVMAVVLLVSLATGRPRQGLPTLSLAVLVLLAWHPDWAANAGFALSALATAALIVIAPGWTEALRRRHVPPLIAEGVAVSAAATVVAAPVIVMISGQISLVSLPANLLAEAAVAPATVLGVLAAALAPWWPGGGAAWAHLAGLASRWLIAVAQLFGSLPGATVAWPRSAPGAVALAVVSGLLIAVVRLRRLRLPILAAAVTALIIQIPVRSVTAGWPANGAIFVVCDVGQGDAEVLPMGHHEAVVVDAGPEPVATDRCLRSLGITTVAVYIQSHYHLDHVGGIGGVFDGRRIGRVYASPLTAPAQGHRLLLDALRPLGIIPLVPTVNTVIDAGPVHLQVIASHIVLVNAVGDPNESSLVVRATVAGHTILLTGDASIQSQTDLLASGEPITADVLKVPHHGSAYFDPSFLAAVHARLGIISVGLHNPYGHPALRLIQDLASLGMRVERTDQDGDVAVLQTPGGLAVQLHRPAQPTAAGPARRVRAPDVEQRHELSDRRATMVAWPGQTQRIRPAVAVWSWSPATRSSSSPVPSSRSPPNAAAPTPKPRSSNATVPNWPRPSCTNYSARRCSVADEP